MSDDTEVLSEINEEDEVLDENYVNPGRIVIRYATVQFTGLTKYIQSSDISPEAKGGIFPLVKGEKPAAREKRLWKKKTHMIEKMGYNGIMQPLAHIPAMAFKKSLDTASQMTKRKITGAGNQTYSKLFKSGVGVKSDVLIEPLVAEHQLVSETVGVSAMGKSGSLAGARVYRTFPVFHKWGGTVVYVIRNPHIEESVFEEYLNESGQLVGIGQWRVEVGGDGGMFRIDSVVWS
jgi:hypothetical protein